MEASDDPVVQRRRRLGDNQESDGSIPSGINSKVGVSAARLLGKQEDRVQFPDGPLGETNMGGWSNGKTPGLQPGDRGSIPRPVHLMQRDGLMVQRDDTALAWWRSEFDSRWVH